MNRPHQGGFNKQCGATFSIVKAASSSSSELAPSPFVASLKTLFSDFVVRECSAHYNDGNPLTLTALASSNEPRREKGASSSTAVQQQATDCSAKLDAAMQKLSALTPELQKSFRTFVEKSTIVKSTNNEEGEGQGDDSCPPPPWFSFGQVSDKQTRSSIHAVVRELLHGTHISRADNGNVVVERASAKELREEDRRLSSADMKKFCHFTLYKENIDSASALRLIAQQLGIPSRRLMFSGTKDKRAITLQRVACKGLTASQLARCNRGSFGRNANVKVGDVVFQDNGLTLGDLRGNHFTIVLRCTAANAVLPTASVLAQVQTVLSSTGFVNYFGPQRFGTTAVLTSDIGLQILRGNYATAVTLILESKCYISPEMQPALDKFRLIYNDTRDAAPCTEDVEAVLKLVPHYCYVERDLLKYLARNPMDFKGALSVVSRTTVMLYCHAVQSWIWNHLSTQRLEKGGLHPIVGDLVAVEKDKSKPTIAKKATDSTEEGNESEEQLECNHSEDVAKPDEEAADDSVDGVLIAVRALTAEDIASGKYQLRDVLVTIPGPDPALRYPTSECLNRAHYSALVDELQIPALLEEHGALAKQYHFHGTYRSLVVVPERFQLEVKQLGSFREAISIPELALTKRQPFKHDREGQGVAAEPQPTTEHQQPTTAVIAAFQLPPGAYATSLLQEFCEVVLE